MLITILPYTAPFHTTSPIMTVPGAQGFVIYTTNPTIVHSIPPQQQQLQQVVTVPVQTLQSAAGVCMPVGQRMLAGGGNTTGCWMHRTPGEIMSLPPPPVGRPGQYVRFADGNTHWVPPRPA